MSHTKVRDGRTTRWEHRRPQLLAAATEYVLENGVANLTLRPLAAAIGVTITTIVRQFGSKEALIQDICRHIHDQLAVELRGISERTDMTPLETLRSLWERWLDPRQARQFTLIFELYGLAIRDPKRYRWFTDSIVRDFLALLDEALIRDGYTPEEARPMGTFILAVVRGLHLDLAATHDTARINAAFELAVELGTSSRGK